MHFKYALLALASTCFISTAAMAGDEAPDYKNNNLTGDWGCARNNLADFGITADIVYKADVMGNVSGGIKEGTRGLDNLDVVFNFDGEKLAGLKGTSALVHLLNNNGGHPDAELVGSAQGIDNIEVPDATGKLYQAWLQQKMFDDKFSVLAGLYDLNSEFYITDSSLLFIHSTYGIGTDIAQSGVQGPSIFPFSALTVRAKVEPMQNTYIQAAVLDGVAGDPTNPRGTQVELNSGDGALVIAEAGYSPGGENPTGKIGIGGWYYTDKFPNHVSAEEKRSKGMYLIGEHKLYSEAKSDTKGLTGFARLGFANGDVNQFNYAWAAGLVYTGLIPSRDEGQLGFAVNGAHNSSKFRESMDIATTPVDTTETAFELTYSDNITPWLAIQPDIQYIVNPGTDPSLDDALVLGSRLTITF